MENDKQPDFFKDLESSFNNLPKPVQSEVGSDISFFSDKITEPFRSQENFDRFKFNPYDVEGNYKRGLNNQDWGKTLSKTYDLFAHNFGNTFIDNFKFYGRLAESIFTFDFSNLDLSDENKLKSFYETQDVMNKSFIFTEKGHESDIFSKKFFYDFVGNSGFMLGTLAGVGVELGAEFAIGLATGGTGFSLIPASISKLFMRSGGKEVLKETSENLAKAAVKSNSDNFFGELSKGWKVGSQTPEQISKQSIKVPLYEKTAKDIANLGIDEVSKGIRGVAHSIDGVLDAMSSIKKGEDFLYKTFKAIPLIGKVPLYAEKVNAARKIGMSGTAISGIIGEGALRLAQEFKLASSESSFESAQLFGDTIDYLIELEKEKGGEITEDKMQQIIDTSRQASYANYKTNLSLLLLSNQLTFGGIFNKYLPALRYSTNEVTRDLFKVSVDGVTQVYKKSPFGVIANAGKIAKDFGRKQALKELGKGFIKTAYKFEFNEGVQEILQETSSHGWKEYYASQYEGVNKSIQSAFGEGITNQFNKQGFNTFIMGAMTGSLFRGPAVVGEYLAEKAMDTYAKRNYEKDLKEGRDLSKHSSYLNKKEFDSDLSGINMILRNLGTNKMDKNLVHFANVTESLKNQTDAANENDIYKFKNNSDNLLLSTILTAKRVGTFDTLLDSISIVGVGMSDDVFESSFGLKLSDTKYKTASEFTDNLAKSLKKYGDTYEGLRLKHSHILANPSNYSKDSLDYNMAVFIRSAQEDAFQVLAMNSLKSEMSLKRLDNIALEFSNTPFIKDSSTYALKILSSPETLESEMGTILSSIASNEALMDGANAELKEEYKIKIKNLLRELKLLKKWSEFWENDVFTGKKKKEVYYEKDDSIISVFAELLNLKNAQQLSDSTEIPKSIIKDSFDKIIDYIRLNKDSRDYLSSSELLANPDSFNKIFIKMLDGKYKYALSYLRQVLYTSDPDNVDKIINHRLFKELSKLIAYNGNSFKFHGYIERLEVEIQELLKEIKNGVIPENKTDDNIKFTTDGTNIVNSDGIVVFSAESEEEAKKEVENLNLEHVESPIKVDVEPIVVEKEHVVSTSVVNSIETPVLPIVLSTGFFEKLNLTDVTTDIKTDSKNPILIHSFLYKKDDNLFVNLLENICK